MHLDDISGEKYALYFHNLLSENVDDLPFISFDDFSVSLENRWNATLCTVVMVVAMDATIARPRPETLLRRRHITEKITH